MLAFDLVSAQGSVNGGAEYARSVFHALVQLPGISLAALFDSHLDLDASLRQTCQAKGIVLVDIRQVEPIAWVNASCTGLYLPIAQRYIGRGLEQLVVPCIMVVHDLRDLELAEFQRRWWPRNWWDPPRVLRSAVRNLAKLSHEDRSYSQVSLTYGDLATLWQKPTTTVITDSQHSRRALEYFFPSRLPSQVRVLRPPVRRLSRQETISHPTLAHLVGSKTPWVLLLGGNRPEKNVLAFLLQAERFFQSQPEFRALIVGRLPPTLARLADGLTQIFNVDSLSESDLAHAYGACFALIYPSLGEGFGYPPLEAMAAGRPVIASNSTSLPEVLGTAALFFNPHSEVELFGQLTEVVANPFPWAQKSVEWSRTMTTHQEEDLRSLVTLLGELAHR